MNRSKTVLWQVHDEKPGHLNQVRGLTNALGELLQLEVHQVPAPSRASSLAALWSKRFLPGEHLPNPDLIIGAGHSTHFALLAARRARGGRTIVLMKPSLPLSLFDLCLVPEHDRVGESGNIVVTRGVLNVIRPTTQHDPRAGLLLIGGPSGAHDWTDEQMLKQIMTITSASSAIQWKLTTSRRTPTTFLKSLSALQIPSLQIVPHQETTPQWVPEQLAAASQVWVSEDSVSMVYEALTSGAAVGLLEVPSKRRGRVAAGVESLLENGWATRFLEWQPGERLPSAPEQLDEARRCAEIVFHRLLAAAAA